MTTKIIKRTRVPLQNVNIFYGDIIVNYPVNKYQQVTATAEFHRPKPSCLNATDFEVVEIWYNPKNYSRGQPNRDYYSGEIDFVYPGAIVSSTKASDDGLEALLRARHKLAGADNNFGETLVELGDTVGLISGRMGSLYRGFSAVLDGRWNKAASSFRGDIPNSVKKLPPSKRLAKGYLELQFGWMPLMNDIHTATRVYYEGLRTRGMTVKARSGSSRPPKSDDGSFDPSKLEASASARGVVSNTRLAQFNELGLLNPALMAWNKLPFSFLVDWFLPVSSVLGAITASAGLSCYQQSVTTKSILTWRKHASTGTSDVFQQTYKGVRKPVSGYPDVSPLLHGSKVQLGLGQVITMAALIKALQH